MRGIRQRRICWPEPDEVCLEGGCTYCNDNQFRGLTVIREYAEKNEKTRKAFFYGLDHDFWNAQTRK